MKKKLPDDQSTILKLYKNDVLLAVLSNIEPDDFPWLSCNFKPTAAFEHYRPLFDHENKLLQDKGATEEWYSAYEKIEALKLTLSYPDKVNTIELFLLHVEGRKARFKASFD